MSRKHPFRGLGSKYRSTCEGKDLAGGGGGRARGNTNDLETARNPLYSTRRVIRIGEERYMYYLSHSSTRTIVAYFCGP